jgi:hypothetical protein
VAAGATIRDIYAYETGEFPDWFIAKIVAWNRGRVQVSSNTEDAVARKMKADSKKRS